MLTIPIASNAVAAPPPNCTGDCRYVEQQLWSILGALAHDLRQPLGVIEICADYLGMLLPEHDPRMRAQLEMMQDQLDEAGRILSEALRLLKSNQRPAKPQSAIAAAS
jgi:signal transduction histidine kinase